MAFFYQCEIPGMPLEKRKAGKGCKDVFHAFMTTAVRLDPTTDIPIMQAETNVPSSVISFSEAIYGNCVDFSSYVHFYEHDTKIERFWNSPWKYMSKLNKFSGLISPDYSSTPGMPKPLRGYNIYRNQLVGAWLQSLGYRVICNVRCPATRDSYSIAGVPRNSLLGIGAVGCIKNKHDRHRFEGGIQRIVDELNPTGLVVVGKDAYGVFDYAKNKAIPLYFFPGPAESYFERGSHE